MEFLLPLLKLVHVVGAIVWVGGATVMLILALVIEARRDDRASLTALSQFGLLGNRVFLPISIVVILTGLTLAWLGGWGFQAWTVLAFLTVLGTFALGGAVLGPSLDRAIKMFEAGDEAGAIALGRWVLRLVKLDLGGQWAIIALMVLKPTWTDPLLLVPAAALAAGALLYVRSAPGKGAAQAA